MKDKRGVLGMDTAKAFILLIFTVLILSFAIIVAVGNLTGSVNLTEQLVNGSVINESFTGNNTIGTPLSMFNVSGVALRNIVVINGSKAAEADPIFTTENFTISGGRITLTSASEFNADNLNITADYSYRIPSIADKASDSILNNATQGIESFWGNAVTWFTMLAIAILILIIALVILAVNRFGGGNSL